MPRPLVLALCVVFLDVMGIGLIVPVLPFIARDYGASGLQVGLLFTAYAAMQFLTTPVLGALSDRFGRRPVLLGSLAGGGLSYLVMALAPNLAILYLSRAVAGATAGNIGAARAYIADITPPAERTRSFSLFGATFGLGFLFGPAIGGLLSQVDVRAPALGASFLVLLSLLFGLVLLPESLPPSRRRAAPLSHTLNPLHVLLTLLRRPLLRGPLLAIFLMGFAFSGLQTNFPVLVGDRFGFGPGEVAQLFVALGVVGIFAQGVLVRRLARRFPDRPILMVGLAVLATSFLLTGFAPTSALLWVSLPLLGLGNALAQAPLMALTSRLVGPSEQGLASGGSQGTLALAAVVGPIWAGLAYESLGQTAPYWSGALFIGASIAVLGLGLRSAARQAEEHAHASFAQAHAHAQAESTGRPG